MPLVRPPLARNALAAALLAVVGAAPARAGDGVLEINQACALQTGCFAGDDPGLPVAITAAAPAKSFRLTGDLVLATDTSAIAIRTSYVRLDLGGFSVRGPVSCQGTPLVCAPLAGSNGIAVDDPATREGVEVRNGAVVGFGGAGLRLGDRSVVESVRAFQNRIDGVDVGAGSLVRDVLAGRNGVIGIRVGEGSRVSGSDASENGGSGISAIVGSAHVLDSVARGNASFGIYVTGGGTISRNVARGNGLLGIRCIDRCTIEGNTATGNGFVSSGDGIQCGVGCAVQGNTSAGNAVLGIRLDVDSAYHANVATGNGFGGIVGGVNRGDNHCAGAFVQAATCP